MKVTQDNLTEAKRLYKKAKVAYYNDDPVMSDAEFDKMEDQIRKLDPSWKELGATGVRTKNKKQEVELLHFMPSLEKQYPQDLPKWKERPINKTVEQWGISAKLDGTSLQLAYRGGRPWKLITRGDGTLGKDISFFLPHLVKLGLVPDSIKTNQLEVVFRCEGMMVKKVFDKKWSKEALGPKEGFDNPRNLVNGLFNRQDMHPALKSVQLVVLGVFGMTQPEGLKFARRNGFKVVDYVERKHLDSHELTEMLEEWRTYSIYEMDGLVVLPTDKPLVYTNADKPKWATAFKVNDEANAPKVEVEKVLWKKTRTKRWQPKIIIKPTRMDGVTVTNVTAHNPAWMMERGIGPGAVVKVLRSGGVIPKIVDVVKKVKFQGPPGDYEVKGRFFVVTEHDEVTEVRALHHFMVTLGIEMLAEKTLAKLYTVGLKSAKDYVDLLNKRQILALTYLEKKGGLGVKMSQKIYQELQRVLGKPIALKTLMVASGCFENGVGARKLAQLEAGGLSMKDLCNGKGTDLYQRILAIKGFKDKTAKAVIDGKLAFTKWIKPIKDYLDITTDAPAAKKVVNGPLTGQKIAWTTYRSPEQQQIVASLGAEVQDKFGAQTTILLYREGGKASSKIEKAGDRAMTWEMFCKKFKVKQ